MHASSGKTEAKLWVKKPGRISRQGGVITKFSHVCVVKRGLGTPQKLQRNWMNDGGLSMNQYVNTGMQVKTDADEEEQKEQRAPLTCLWAAFLGVPWHSP